MRAVKLIVVTASINEALITLVAAGPQQSQNGEQSEVNSDDLPFNRGQLSNIGTLEAEKHGDYDCFVYHDVDLIPEKSKTTYKCFPWPLHLAIGVEQSQYIPYYGGVGGVAIVPKQLIHQVNGHSNNFWGWGGEDDDLLLRFNSQGFNVMHYPAEVGRYRSLPHVPASPSPNRS
ncbi:unnamed protein product, partial [Notodromas monacha]